MRFHETCINSGKGLLCSFGPFWLLTQVLFEIEILGMDKNTNWLANGHSINYISFGHPYFALMKSMMVPVNTTCILRSDWLDWDVGVFTKYPCIDSWNNRHEAGTRCQRNPTSTKHFHVSIHNKWMGTLSQSSRYQTMHMCWYCWFKSLSFPWKQQGSFIISFNKNNWGMFFIIWKPYLFNISTVKLKSKLWLFKVCCSNVSPEKEILVTSRVSEEISILLRFAKILNSAIKNFTSNDLSCFLHSVYSLILLLDDNGWLICVCFISGYLCETELMSYKRATSEQKSPHLK